MNAISRREFIAGAAAAAGAAALGAAFRADGSESRRIAKVETFPFSYPTVGRFKFFEDAQGRPTGRQTVLVRITTEDGVSGWGQSVPIPRWSYETLETVQTTIERHLGPLLIGRDPFDIEGIHAEMNRAIAPSFSTGQPICKAGIDLALFDLTGRILRQTAEQRWKRRGIRRITLSWTLNPLKIGDVEGLIEQGRARGYRNFNIKVAPNLKFDLELARVVKRLAPEGFLWADANGGYDEATALEAAPKLAEAGVAVLEQPLPTNRITGYQKLVRQKALPIIMDEGVVSSTDLEEFIRLKALDGVAMKPARCAGLTDARRQVELLEENGLMFLGSGLTDPDVSLAASLLLYGAYGLKYPAALNGPQFLEGTSVLKKPLLPEGGELTVPEGPGLGVEVDLEKLEAGAWRTRSI